MKISYWKFAALLALVIGLLPTSATFANGNDDGNFKFKGTIESLPDGSGFAGDWRVSGRTVRVTFATKIELEGGQVEVGAFVEVKGDLQTDGSVDAGKIEVKGAGAAGEMEFKGTIENFPAGFIGNWMVGGRIVIVTTSTVIEQEHGPVAVGAFVEVKGATQADGSINAVRIEVKSNVTGGDGRHEIKGVIEALPDAQGFIGDWRVSGVIVRVSATTRIEQEHGPLAVGALVEVKGSLQTDGSLDATSIETKTSFDGGGSSGSSNGSGSDNVKFKAAIESMPATGLIGDWMIGGRAVHVTSSTRVKQQHGAVGIGVRVKVTGIQLDDNTIVATKIQVRDSN